jgi:hypothetical protein
MKSLAESYEKTPGYQSDGPLSVTQLRDNSGGFGRCAAILASPTGTAR